MLRILLVDDNDLVAATFAAVAELGGFEAHVVYDGREAMAAHSATPFDIVVTDIFMPKVDGFELLREMRRLDPSTPVIVISGGPRSTLMVDLEFDCLEMARALGARIALSKPVRARALLTALRECAEGLQPRGSLPDQIAGAVSD